MSSASRLALLAACLSTAAHAAAWKPLSLTADLTWSSKYVTDGFRIGGDHAVWQPSISVTTPLNGLSVLFWSSLQVDRSNQQYDEFDLMARYARPLFEGKRYALNVHGFYDYWDYPKLIFAPDAYGGADSPQNMRGNKLSAGFSLVNLVPFLGSHVVPSYNAYYWLYWAQNRRDQYQGGTRHEFMLQYSRDIPRFVPGAKEQYAGVSASINYNDGAFGVAPGWSHSTAQLSSGVYALGCLFSLSVNRQWTYQKSVDPNDELWSTFSFTKSF